MKRFLDTRTCDTCLKKIKVKEERIGQNHGYSNSRWQGEIWSEEGVRFVFAQGDRPTKNGIPGKWFCNDCWKHILLGIKEDRPELIDDKWVENTFSSPQKIVRKV